MPLAFALRAKG
jgi:hypothetical protein